MAHHTEQTGFPALPLSAGMQLRIEAISTNTDSSVAGVTSTRWSIYGYDETDAAGGVEDVIPLFTAQAGQ